MKDEQNMNKIKQIQDNQDNNWNINIGYRFENQINKSNNVIHINVEKNNEDIKLQQSKIDEED